MNLSSASMLSCAPFLAATITVFSYLEATAETSKCGEANGCLLLKNGKPDYRSYEAQVIKVIDADTLRLRIYVLPGLTYEINIRSRGIDAPEFFQPACLKEKLSAEEAKSSIERKFPVDSWVLVRNLEFGKYGQRLVGDIDRWISDRFQSVTEELLDKPGRWGVPDPDGTSEYDWCKEAS